ncbi:hypothetical protein SS50377_26449 [Spironucleus salmonicida]|uniref:Uncharacterized protein n=1 Tax=Spironucleus salmonicida TaxID=348837 RepID=V6LKV4_9EUKA|nr:hypothetical protein SS50377_26449 [Spironucleus salmonicida]|eukprot:EST41309.1 Hypothetical protein SS50377_19021 [Spironucleus salmonicida]
MQEQQINIHLVPEVIEESQGLNYSFNITETVKINYNYDDEIIDSLLQSNSKAQYIQEKTSIRNTKQERVQSNSDVNQ